MMFLIIILVVLLKIKIAKLNIFNSTINFYKFYFIGIEITLSIFVLFGSIYDNIYYFMYFLIKY